MMILLECQQVREIIITLKLEVSRSGERERENELGLRAKDLKSFPFVTKEVIIMIPSTMMVFFILSNI